MYSIDNTTGFPIVEFDLFFNIWNKMHLSAPYGLFIVNNYASEQLAHV